MQMYAAVSDDSLGRSAKCYTWRRYLVIVQAGVVGAVYEKARANHVTGYCNRLPLASAGGIIWCRYWYSIDSGGQVTFKK